MKPRILFQPGTQLETAIEQLQGEVKMLGPVISRNQALRFFAELGREHWCQDKEAKNGSAGSEFDRTPL
jgi:hypothetical protein